MKKRNGTGKMTAVSCCISAIIVWIAIGATCQAESRPLEVVYPRPESADDTRDLDAVEILRTALEKTEPSRRRIYDAPHGACDEPCPDTTKK